MSVGAGSSSSQSSSRPLDMTSPEFQALRGPFAQVVGSLLGFSPGAIMGNASQLPAGGQANPGFSGGPVLGGPGQGSGFSWAPDGGGAPSAGAGGAGPSGTWMQPSNGAAGANSLQPNIDPIRPGMSWNPQTSQYVPNVSHPSMFGPAGPNRAPGTVFGQNQMFRQYPVHPGAYPSVNPQTGQPFAAVAGANNPASGGPVAGSASPMSAAMATAGGPYPNPILGTPGPDSLTGNPNETPNPGGPGGTGGVTANGGALGNAVMAGIPAWQGPMAAGMSEGEQTMLTQLMQNQMGGRNPLLERTMAGEFLPGQPGSNPFLQSAIEAAQRPTLQGLQETLDRTLPGRFALAGQTSAPGGSSAFDRHAAMAARDAGQTMADVASKMSFEGYESERGRQMEAVKLSQTEVDTMIKNLQAQALPRLIEDLGIERGMQEFQGRVNQLLQVLGTMTGAPMVSLGNQSQSSSKSSQFSFGLPMGG